MENLIYYPGFEIRDSNWLKFARILYQYFLKSPTPSQDIDIPGLIVKVKFFPSFLEIYLKIALK